MNKKKRHTVSPEAAKILEQYRNAGKTPPGGGESGAPSEGSGGIVPPRPAAPPPSKVQQRSGNRGK